MLEYYFNIEGDLFRLPVNPKKLPINAGATIDTINMTTKGQVTLFAGNEVDTISFSSFWPKTFMPYCNHNEIRSPETFKVKMLKAKTEGIKVRFIVTKINFNKLFYIQKFNPVYEENQPGVLQYEVTLVECINPTIPSLSDKKINERISKFNKKGNVILHIVKKGDCLWDIAKKYYGDGKRFKEIVKENKDILTNGNFIKAGMKLVISFAK